MKTGYYRQNDEAYRKIFRRVCRDFQVEDASFADFKSKAISKLPKKDRKHLENYFGINGGINHADKAFRLRKAGKKLDRAEIEMERKADSIIESMHSLDYLVLFHRTIQDLVEKISRKTTGEEDAIEATKWALVYSTMILNGPYIFYDQEWKVQSEKKIKDEASSGFNLGLFMSVQYEGMFSGFPDGDIIIPLVKNWSENLDVSDRVTILDFFGIKRPKYLEEYEGEKLQSYADLRALKEKLYPSGCWVTDGFFFVKTNHLNKELIEQINLAFESIRDGSKLKLAEPEKYPFGTGERDIVLYSIDTGEGEDTLEFPSVEEIMIMYPLWMDYITEN